MKQKKYAAADLPVTVFFPRRRIKLGTRHVWGTVITDEELSADKLERNCGYDKMQLLQTIVHSPGTLITTYLI